MARTLSRTRRTRDEEEDYSPPADADEYGNDGDGDSGADSSRSRRSSRSSRRGSESNEERGSSRGRRSGGGRSSSSVGRGWSAHKANSEKAASRRYNDGDKFTVDKDQKYIIMFLEDGPFATWLEHWVNEITEGKRSFVCLGEDECPLCAIDYPFAERAAFNVAVFDRKGNPVVKYWVTTPQPLGLIEKAADKRRTSPINREGLYFEVSKTQLKNKRWEYSLEDLTEEDLEAEGLTPLTEDELNDLRTNLFKEDDVVKLDTRSALQEIADDLED